ncbi:hypothetical protein [Streptococcus pluranimalium]|uniref:hypothetical protein n=1 Tax=Streptococcus pluranimalium TaxID=82348 RepID=UPI003F693187
MSLIYKTNSWSGYSKGSSYWNEYRLEGNRIIKYKCSSIKFFDGNENVRETEETEVDSWGLDDESMPEWLREHL